MANGGAGPGTVPGIAKEEFADTDNADAWLVAYARVSGRTVVTNEVYAAEARKQVKFRTRVKPRGGLRQHLRYAAGPWGKFPVSHISIDSIA